MCANRDCFPQFFEGTNLESFQYYNERIEVSNQDFLGLVLDYDENSKMVTIEERNYFKKGDVVEIFGPNILTITYTIDTIIDSLGNVIDVVRHPNQIVKMPLDISVPVNSMMRIKRNNL